MCDVCAILSPKATADAYMTDMTTIVLVSRSRTFHISWINLHVSSHNTEEEMQINFT